MNKSVTKDPKVLSDLKVCFSLVTYQKQQFNYTPSDQSDHRNFCTVILNHEILEGYQKYYGKKAKSLKSGCGFYVTGDTNFKPRNDLNL